MISNKPYLIRAFYEWIVDSECTPYLAVNADMPKVSVPDRFIQDGQIILNISPNAVRDLLLNNHYISFKATFGGIEESIYVPIQAVLAIYAKENSEGMSFDIDLEDDPAEGSSDDSSKPDLHIV